MKKYLIKAYNIDYSIDEEDVCSQFDNDPEIEEDTEEYYYAIENKISEIRSQLPKEMSFKIECDNVSDLEDLVCNYITEKTGWLLNGFNFDYEDCSKPVVLYDYFGRSIKKGDKVVLLYKTYRFNGIDSAHLIDAIYCGKGRWGYEFERDFEDLSSDDFDYIDYDLLETIRVRNPECIKVMKGGKSNVK